MRLFSAQVGLDHIEKKVYPFPILCLQSLDST